MSRHLLSEEKSRELCAALYQTLGHAFTVVMLVVDTNGGVRVISTIKDEAAISDLLAFAAAEAGDNYGQTEIRVSHDA